MDNMLLEMQFDKKQFEEIKKLANDERIEVGEYIFRALKRDAYFSNEKRNGNKLLLAEGAKLKEVEFGF